MPRQSATKNGEAAARQGSGLVVYTVGHSTMDLDSFLDLLKTTGIDMVADVRAIPRSLHNPQFNKETLSPYLRVRRIKYRHLKDLGGLRRHMKDDPRNAGWHNASFRGFADYMQTPEFAAGLEELIAWAGKRTVAIMCAEAVPWRCHRSLIGDALLVRGIEVLDVFPSGTIKPHHLSPLAAVDGHRITYPAPPEEENGERLAE
ncbi:DUF488 domain-containing protein [Geomonas sp. Red32]|uniref:DUF488 domain-containing protein n=1 Tax=Geomonas sp. Red32 TaxID=2912856 RepID=UPI00202CB99F|nr:DUF488 domain-containing protein [Geomonas sp. Red32]MCM0084142.1 DUF488 domain-containing protein [Geomonas sp. Red32]